jgi:predicted lipoprotein with Yx(FWY)xxD motif
VIILLSDGLNTQDRRYTNASSIDARQQKTCDNIKAAGITIYTVQVNTDGEATSTLLQNCASNTTGTTDHFFLLTSSDQIVTTFNQIGTSLSNLRLAM